MLERWTSPQTFGDPQLFFLIAGVVLLTIAAVFGVVTIARELKALRTHRRP